MEEFIPDNFLGIPEIPPEEAEVLVLPIPLEATVSYGKGTGRGPKAIITASQQVEQYDHELGYEVNQKVKIATLPAINFPEQNAEKAQDIISNVAKNWTNKFLLSLGGHKKYVSWRTAIYKQRTGKLWR